MENVFKYGGWAAALVMLICVGLLLGRPTLTTDIVVESQDSTPVSRNPDEPALLAELESVKADKTKLEAELAALKAEVAAAEAMPATTEPEPAQAEKPAAPKAPDSDQVDAEAQGERAAIAAVGIQADMMYRDLFDELNLPPEVQAALKESIATHMLSMQREMMSAMGAKDQTAKAFNAHMDAMKGAMRDELAAMLTPEEMKAWDEYEPVADQLLYERLVDGQLSMMAPGLLGENRTLASQVFAEELVREFDTFNQSDELYTRDNFNGAQTRALNASLDRLAGALDEAQLSQVRGFVEQAIGMFEAMAEQ